MADITDPFADLGLDPAPNTSESVDDLLNTVDLFPSDTGSAPAPARPAASQSKNIFPSDDAKRQERPRPSGIFEITVSDPEKKGENMYAYVSYKVNTKTVDDNGKVQQSSVVRRYSDFAWLHTQLVEKYPGWLIPPVPEKAIMGRFSPMFVDSRRRGLELFLNRLSKHQELAKSQDFMLFLQGGHEFQDIKDGKVVVEEEEPKKAKGFFDYFNAVAQTVQTSLGVAKEHDKTKEDLACEGIDAYATSLDNSVSAVHKNISTLTGKTKDLANAWFDFGYACTVMGQYETEQEEQHLGNAFAKLGNTADRLSVLLAQQVDNQIIHFQEPFNDFILIIGAVKGMLQSRQSQLNKYYLALDTLESKQTTLLRYRGHPEKADKAQAVQLQVEEAQRKVDAEKRTLDEITERVFSETARFRKEKKVNFKNAMVDFVRMQIEHAKRVQNAWESILPELEGLPFDG